MWKDRPEVLMLAKDFVKICEDNKIWYTADNGTLLGAVRHKGIIPWDDDFDVMMTFDSFEKLKKLYSKRVIDTDEKGYPLLIPKFMFSKEQYLHSAVFVDIFLVVPTNKKGIKRFTSFRNKTRFAIQCTHSEWKKFNLGSKILWVISWPFKWIPKRMTYQEALNILSVPTDKVTHFYTIDNPIDPVGINKQDILSLKREKMDFEDFKVYVPVEYKNVLTNKYSKNYMTPIKTARSIEHVNAISIKKVNRKKINYENNPELIAFPQNDNRINDWNDYKKMGDISLEYIKDVSYIFDVGANVGDHTTYFAWHRPNSKVFGFEPVSSLFEMAQKNLEHNNIRNIELFQYGVGNSSGELDITINNESSSFVSNLKSKESEKVKVIRLDDFKEKRCDFIKIDVEGFGLNVLLGAEELIKRNKPVVSFEFHPFLAGVKDSVKNLEFFKRHGYKIEREINKVEFIFSVSSGIEIDISFLRKRFSKISDEKQISNLRRKYDVSTSKKELKNLREEYRGIENKNFTSMLLWSHLYRFFTFKWLKTK